MNDPDQAIIWPRGDELPGRLWADDTPVDEDDSASGAATGLVSLGFFTSTLRRRARVWCLTGLIGLVIGTGLYVKFPPAHHATASVLLVYNQNQNPQTEVANEASLAQSQVVAERVVKQLNLRQTVASFQAAYSVTVVTDNVLTINVGAPSSAAAVQRVSALATNFLQYRAEYTRTQQQLLFTQLNQEYNAAQQRLTALQTQASQFPSAELTGAQKTQYDTLQSQIGQQEQIMQYVTATEATTKTYTTATTTGSYIVNAPTALPRSKVKGPGLYFAGGLFGGIVVGMGIVVVGALLSRRLRRRSDVATALGAPVKLSVGPLRARRWRPAPRRQAARRDRDIRRVAGFLRGAVPGSSRGPASLAVVAVDDAEVAARVVAVLASACAAEGKKVVVADLSSDAHLAHLLGTSDPGLHQVSHNGAELVLLVPEGDEVAPAGPLLGGASPAVPATASAALISACDSADLLLSLATLDPAIGGDYLGTWTTDAVVLVTAGESSVEKIQSVGEMIRLAGPRLESAVLIGADKSDLSIGVINAGE